MRDDAMQSPPDAVPMPQGAPATPPPSYSPQQLDQLVAPVALYPDTLLGQVFIASTYPLEIVEASRWRQDPANANLQGDQLANALIQQPWDPSVKSLVAFPDVLSMMDKNLQWTEQLGDAFLAQQTDVSNSVQNLRQRAETAGHLASSPQQTVEGGQGAIVIQPAQPNVVYVPSYNPQVVYGAWPYASYPPYYFPASGGYYYGNQGLIGFGAGIAVANLFWGWDSWDWRRHHIDINEGGFSELGGGLPVFGPGGQWEHDPNHRHGVPYNSSAVREHYGAEAHASRQNFRGYSGNASAGHMEAGYPTSVANRGANGSGSRDNFQHMGYAPSAQSQHNVEHSVASPQNIYSRPAPEVRTQQYETQRMNNATAERAAPMYESFQRGPDVRAQSQRGAYSRASAPSPQIRQVSQQGARAGASRPEGGGSHPEAAHASAPHAEAAHGGEQHSDQRSVH